MLHFKQRRLKFSCAQLKSPGLFLVVIALLSASPTLELALAYTSPGPGNEHASASELAPTRDSGLNSNLVLGNCSTSLTKEIHLLPSEEFNSSADLDERLNRCIQDTLMSLQPQLAAGIPDLCIPPLDPYEVGEFRLDPVEGFGERLGFKFGRSAGARAKNQIPMSIAANFTNVVIHNLTNGSNIEVKVITNVDNRRTTFDYGISVPSIRIEGNYSLIGDGVPVFRRIEGQGPFWMELFGLEINGTKILSSRAKLNTTEKRVRKPSTMTVQHIKLEMQNLFNGNQMLGAIINRRLNGHAMEIFDELKPQFIAEVGNLIEKISDLILRPQV